MVAGDYETVMNPTNRPAKVILAGHSYQLYFDLNTFTKYEEVSGSSFTQFISDLQDAVQAVAETGNNMEFLRRINLRQLTQFLYSALHGYDPQDEPYWPLTIGQLGRLVDAENMVSVVRTLLQGYGSNAPSAEEASSVTPDEDPTSPPPPVVPIADTGRKESGPSDAEVLGSLTKKSDG